MLTNNNNQIKAVKPSFCQNENENSGKKALNKMREKELDQAKLKSEFESQIDQQIEWPKELKPLIKHKYVFNVSDRASWEA